MGKLKTRIKFTYKDYKSLPESETRRYELIRKLFMPDMASGNTGL